MEMFLCYYVFGFKDRIASLWITADNLSSLYFHVSGFHTPQFTKTVANKAYYKPWKTPIQSYLLASVDIVISSNFCKCLLLIFPCRLSVYLDVMFHKLKKIITHFQFLSVELWTKTTIIYTHHLGHHTKFNCAKT